MTDVPRHHLHLEPVFGAVSAFDAAGLVVAGGVEDQFADEGSGVVLQDADVEVVDEHGDFGAAASLAQADVVQAAVVADGDDVGGVDGVVADPVVRRDLVAAGEGLGPVVKRLDRGFAVRGLGAGERCCSRPGIR